MRINIHATSPLTPLTPAIRKILYEQCEHGRNLNSCCCNRDANEVALICTILPTKFNLLMDKSLQVNLFAICPD